MSWNATPPQYQQQIPPDLQNFRTGQVDLLNALLGIGGENPEYTAYQKKLEGLNNLQRAQSASPSSRYNTAGGALHVQGLIDRMGPAPAKNLPFQGPSGIDRLKGIFGDWSSPTTGLQRQSTDALSHYLNMPSPEQRALDTSMPALQNILGGRPGQGVIDALQPSFERNLAAANQQGGRFSSGNAILRSRAVDDFNLLGAQAAQQGQNTQLQAAQMLALLSGQAGQNPFQRAVGAYGVGQQEAGQADIETQRRLELIANMLGIGQGATFNAPYTQTKAGSPGIADILLGLGGMAIGNRIGGGG